jgi:hypothetical protein
VASSLLAAVVHRACSHKHRGRGVNALPVTDPDGRTLRISPALPGRTHDLTAARTHRITRICERQGIPVLADRGYTGAGPWVATPLRRPPDRGLTATQQAVNRALSADGAGRAWRRTTEGMTDLPRSPVQLESNVASICAAVLTPDRQLRPVES